MLPIHKFKKVDVRPLLDRGEEPFAFVQKKVDSLAQGQGLIVLAPFLPSPLIEWFGSKGFRSRIERGLDGAWIVYFWREPNQGGL